MSVKVEYYCDCCKKQIKNSGGLRNIVITRRVEPMEESMYETIKKEVCIECWEEYQDGMVKVGKELFDSKSKKEIEKEDIKTEKDRAEITMVIGIEENNINEMIKEFKLVIQELDSRIKRSIEEFKESIKTTAYQNID